MLTLLWRIAFDSVVSQTNKFHSCSVTDLVNPYSFCVRSRSDLLASTESKLVFFLRSLIKHIYIYNINIYIIYIYICEWGFSVRSAIHTPYASGLCLAQGHPLYSGRHSIGQLLVTLTDQGKECTPCPAASHCCHC